MLCRSQHRTLLATATGAMLVSLYLPVGCGVPDVEYEGGHCNNGFQDGDETDKDCGGETCEMPCAAGRKCKNHSDCVSDRCVDGRCFEPSCQDGIKNGDESDTDCGGPSRQCRRCEPDERCNEDGDCTTGRCSEGGFCERAPTCDDEVKNGDESDTDCGGPSPLCRRCEPDEACNADSDCSTGRCSEGGFCERAPTCDDEIKNGDESDTDCGGPSPLCRRCEPDEACNADSDCSTGSCGVDRVCQIVCEAGRANCDSKVENGCEVDLTTDVENCGGCNESCSLPHASVACSNRECVIDECNSGWGDCNGDDEDGCETDLETTVAHCGGCHDACEVPTGPHGEIYGSPVCDGGVCSADCNEPYANCEPEPVGSLVVTCETNTQQDPEHCTGCGEECPSGASAAICVNGICGFSQCVDPTTGNCEQSDPDCEADLTSWQTCGDCGTICTPLHAEAPVCELGICGYSECKQGYADCDRDRPNGCEADLSSDARHCGSCDSPCPPPHVASGACVDGSCEWSPEQDCAPGFGNCDDELENGCETNTDTSLADCGACDAPCSGAHVASNTLACVSGECVGECSGFWRNCFNGLRDDGCETDTSNNEEHCGGCNRACPPAHVTSGTCLDGTCMWDAPEDCAEGYAHCDDNLVNGCETDILNDRSHCGACDAVCPPPHVTTAACVEGVCDWDRTTDCAPGWDHCDDDLENGCEADVRADVENCGACDRSCNGLAPRCEAGKCMDLQVYVRRSLLDTNPTDNQIRIELRICNGAQDAATLNNAVLRYWLNPDGATRGDLLPVGMVTLESYRPSGAAEKALVRTVPQATVVSGDGGCTDSLSLEWVAVNASMQESNDYSYTAMATATAWTRWDHIGLYESERLLSGIEPP